jgi:hypothetical protein
MLTKENNYLRINMSVRVLIHIFQKHINQGNTTVFTVMLPFTDMSLRQSSISVNTIVFPLFIYIYIYILLLVFFGIYVLTHAHSHIQMYMNIIIFSVVFSSCL